ncbi:RNA polymerase sigma factor [Alkalicoccus luteus]|uniref:RNA polymerase sigma factor n=1 Tax=Alkalicoccus luteus TaxID=1237094 RepID=A0A969PQ91_9BACI|nr:RNA polymerase sigma factor [Alkalicoccus luteus]NJP37575.1 RNA polymerase sigma factor [Alkalicoccus luteus]
MTDEELVQRILQGEQEALENLHERHADGLYRYIYAKTSNRMDAEELLQDVFFKAAKHLPSFQEKASFKTWLYRIARNALTDYYRSRTVKHRAVPTEAQVLEAASGFADSPEETVVQQSAVADIAELINGLPSDYQEVLHLRLMEDFSTKETAAVMGKSMLSVKALYRRAKKKLAAELREGGEAHGS